MLILRIVIIRSDHLVEDTGNDICSIVLIRNKAVRQLIVNPVAAGTLEPPDNERFPLASFTLSDPLPRIPVVQGSTATGAGRASRSGKDDENFMVSLVNQSVILYNDHGFFTMVSEYTTG